MGERKTVGAAEAGRVLKGDLENVMEKVKEGRTLTGPERAIFAGLKLETEDLQRKRQLALLTRWAGGKRLSENELFEIADLLPAGSVASESEEPEEKKRSGRASRTGFEHGYDFYAERYGASARTVKRWVKIGREADDATPLDDPLRMRSWWARCMKLRCPAGVVGAEVEALKAAPEKVAERPEEVPVVEGVPEVARVQLETEERGLAGALARMEQMEVKLAERADQPGQAKPWLDTISRMTSVATKLRQELVEQGKLVPKNEVAAELKGYHGQIVSVLKSALPDHELREVFELLKGEVFS